MQTLVPSTSAMYFNLSPQGDGNEQLHAVKNGLLAFQLIPARGRKPLDASHGGVPLTISTYPRKGTETGSSHLQRKIYKISTYPRKGTETHRP